MFKTILVATDGSDHGRNATRIAGSLAGKLGAKLYVAHVVTGQPVPEALRRMAEVEHLVKDPEPEQRSSLGHLSLRPSPRAANERIAAAVATRVLEQCGKLAKGEGAEEVVPLELTGEAAEALIEAVGRHKIDLVVIGSRGFGRLGRLVHGSVSTQVSQEVACPCLVVK
jgi:nucleotide-binding universal stress UspA family protein